MPQIAGNVDAPDYAAWLLTVPGIPADWPAHFFTLPHTDKVVPQNIGVVPNGDGLTAKP